MPVSDKSDSFATDVWTRSDLKTNSEGDWKGCIVLALRSCQGRVYVIRAICALSAAFHVACSSLPPTLPPPLFFPPPSLFPTVTPSTPSASFSAMATFGPNQPFPGSSSASAPQPGPSNSEQTTWDGDEMSASLLSSPHCVPSIPPRLSSLTSRVFLPLPPMQV